MKNKYKVRTLFYATNDGLEDQLNEYAAKGWILFIIKTLPPEAGHPYKVGTLAHCIFVKDE